MKLTQQLALSQLKTNRKRTIWTLLGILLSTAMITAVYGFAASGMEAVYQTLDGAPIRQEYYSMVIGIGVVLSVIIMTVSITVVSNSFRISAGKRMSEFGILKSVGATKKQIASTILYESVFLSVIGIPIGLATGLFVQFIGISIANHLLGEMGRSRGAPLFGFVLSWQAMIASVAVAIVTILLAAWLPARKAAKIPAIDAIRGVGEVKIKRRQVRTSRIIKLLFGFEGTLAAKSLKRSKRNLRATVVSITISIVLFIAASGFGTYFTRMTSIVFHFADIDVVVAYHSSLIFIEREDGSHHSLFQPISPEKTEYIAAKLREFPDTEIFSVGSSAGRTWGNRTLVPEDMLSPAMFDYLTMRYRRDPHPGGFRTELSVEFVTVDAESYARLARLAGVPYGSNILINQFRRQIDGNWTEFVPFVFSGQTLQVPWRGLYNQYTTTDITLHGELRGADIPSGILHASRSYLIIIVPPFDVGAHFWFAQSADPHGFSEHAFAILDQYIQRDGEIHLNTSVQNLVAQQNNDRNIARLFMTFIYGFVGMLTLVGLTNVISTISTNVSSRSREFAVLKSVGMTQAGLNRMINLESILCSAKSLIIGLPFGVGASYLVYRSITAAVHFPYEFPWIAVLQCIAAVFIITWVTMRFAAARLKDENIVDAILT